MDIRDEMRLCIAAMSLLADDIEQGYRKGLFHSLPDIQTALESLAKLRQLIESLNRYGSTAVLDEAHQAEIRRLIDKYQDLAGLFIEARNDICVAAADKKKE